MLVLLIFHRQRHKFKLKTWKNEKRRTTRKLDFLRVFVQDLHLRICNLLDASTQQSNHSQVVQRLHFTLCGRKFYKCLKAIVKATVRNPNGHQNQHIWQKCVHYYGPLFSMRAFYLKNRNDTTNNRINGNVKVKQHERNCSDFEKRDF